MKVTAALYRRHIINTYEQATYVQSMS